VQCKQPACRPWFPCPTPRYTNQTGLGGSTSKVPSKLPNDPHFPISLAPSGQVETTSFKPLVILQILLLLLLFFLYFSFFSQFKYSILLAR
jgi:hypothetical protein